MSLSTDNKMARLSALRSLAADLAANPAALLEAEGRLAAVAIRLSDDSEACRETAVTLLTHAVTSAAHGDGGSSANLAKSFPIIAAAVVSRFVGATGLATAEPSEELRHSNVRLLNAMLAAPAAALALHDVVVFGNVVAVLRAGTGDAYHAVNLEAATGLMLLASAAPALIRSVAGAVSTALCRCLSNGRAPVRLAALNALHRLMPLAGEATCMTVLDTVLPALGPLRWDRAESVRRQLALTLAHWLTTLPAHALTVLDSVLVVPLLGMCAAHDERDVAETALVALADAATHRSAAALALKAFALKPLRGDALDLDVAAAAADADTIDDGNVGPDEQFAPLDVSQLPADFATTHDGRAAVLASATAAFVRPLLGKIVFRAATALGDNWSPRERGAVVAALVAGIAMSGTRATQPHLQAVLAILTTCARDDDAVVRAHLRTVAWLLGATLALDDIVDVVLAALRATSVGGCMSAAGGSLNDAHVGDAENNVAVQTATGRGVQFAAALLDVLATALSSGRATTEERCTTPRTGSGLPLPLARELSTAFATCALFPIDPDDTDATSYFHSALARALREMISTAFSMSVRSALPEPETETTCECSAHPILEVHSEAHYPPRLSQGSQNPLRALNEVAWLADDSGGTQMLDDVIVTILSLWGSGDAAIAAMVDSVARDLSSALHFANKYALVAVSTSRLLHRITSDVSSWRRETPHRRIFDSLLRMARPAIAGLSPADAIANVCIVVDAFIVTVGDPLHAVKAIHGQAGSHLSRDTSFAAATNDAALMGLRIVQITLLDDFVAATVAHHRDETAVSAVIEPIEEIQVSRNQSTSSFGISNENATGVVVVHAAGVGDGPQTPWPLTSASDINDDDTAAAASLVDHNDALVVPLGAVVQLDESVLATSSRRTSRTIDDIKSAVATGALLSEGGAHTVCDATVDAALRSSGCAVRLIECALLPNAVWRPGSVAATMRRATLSCVLDLLKCGLVPVDALIGQAEGRTVLLPFSRHLVSILVSCSSDDEAATRRLACCALAELLVRCCGGMSGDDVTSLCINLLKCLDDASDSVRIAACSATRALAKAAPRYELEGPPAELVVETLLIHLDDNDAAVCSAAYDAVLPWVRMAPAFARGRLNEARSRFQHLRHIERLSGFLDDLT